MIEPGTIWVVIVAGGLATYALRVSFLTFARKLTDLPPTVAEALRMIPAAALAALAAPAILRPDGAFDPLTTRSVAAAIAVLVALRTRNLAITIAAGMAAVLAFELLA